MDEDQYTEVVNGPDDVLAAVMRLLIRTGHARLVKRRTTNPLPDENYTLVIEASRLGISDATADELKALLPH